VKDSMFGFGKVNLTDHQFAHYVKGLDYKHNGKSTSWINKEGVTMALVFYDNARLTRDIWIKESE
jgi:hypothetical protein